MIHFLLKKKLSSFSLDIKERWFYFEGHFNIGDEPYIKRKTSKGAKDTKGIHFLVMFYDCSFMQNEVMTLFGFD